MGTIISHGIRQDMPNLSMSNGLTSVFIGVLSIAMAALAQRDSERRIAVWLAAHDQAIYGRGTVDFTVSEIPWTSATFDADKQFVLDAIDAAAGKLGWEKLGYHPEEDWVVTSLRTFEDLVQHFLPAHVASLSREAWQLGEVATAFERCARHGVYLHSHGCVLCNDI